MVLLKQLFIIHFRSLSEKGLAHLGGRDRWTKLLILGLLAVILAECCAYLRRQVRTRLAVLDRRFVWLSFGDFYRIAEIFLFQLKFWYFLPILRKALLFLANLFRFVINIDFRIWAQCIEIGLITLRLRLLIVIFRGLAIVDGDLHRAGRMDSFDLGRDLVRLILAHLESLLLND